jgi:cytochrome c biogenesis protein CcmG, thiol:disulfide interchange protein DsbE
MNTKEIAEPKSSKWVIVAVGIAGVVALVVASILLTRKSPDTVVSAEVVQETSQIVITGTPLVPHPDATNAVDAAIGSQAPKVDGETFSGQTETIAPGSKPMVLAFVAHWCAHCQREVPKLANWARGGTRNGVEIRAIATSTTAERPNYPPSAWLAKAEFDVPTLADDEPGTAANAYGLTSFPFFVAIDATGKVTARVSGELAESEFDALVASTKR